MKALLTTLITFLFFNVSAQENNNFKIENGALIWQKVYESKFSPEDISNQLKSKGVVKHVNLSNNMLTGDINTQANYKGAGFREMNIPMFVPRNDISCSVTINFKEGRYRVTLRNFKLIANTEDPLTEIGETSTLETYALKKRNTAFKDNFLGAPSQIYNYTFNNIFLIKDTKNDNW